MDVATLFRMHTLGPGSQPPKTVHEIIISPKKEMSWCSSELNEHLSPQELSMLIVSRNFLFPYLEYILSRCHRK